MQRRRRLNQTRPELIVATGRSEIARMALLTQARRSHRPPDSQVSMLSTWAGTWFYR